MKIGFSFGRCVRDIVDGRVSIDDVLLIIARTKCPTLEDCLDVATEYNYYGPLGQCDLEECHKVVTILYTTGRLHQPRLYGTFPTMVAEQFLWMDVFPTIAEENPFVKGAWDAYQMALRVGSDKVVPELHKGAV